MESQSVVASLGRRAAAVLFAAAAWWSVAAFALLAFVTASSASVNPKAWMGFEYYLWLLAPGIVGFVAWLLVSLDLSRRDMVRSVLLGVVLAAPFVLAFAVLSAGLRL